MVSQLNFGLSFCFIQTDTMMGILIHSAGLVQFLATFNWLLTIFGRTSLLPYLQVHFEGRNGPGKFDTALSG